MKRWPSRRKEGGGRCVCEVLENIGWRTLCPTELVAFFTRRLISSDLSSDRISPPSRLFCRLTILLAPNLPHLFPLILQGHETFR